MPIYKLQLTVYVVRIYVFAQRMNRRVRLNQQNLFSKSYIYADYMSESTANQRRQCPDADTRCMMAYRT